jgi:shikimate dehydrogenase
VAASADFSFIDGTTQTVALVGHPVAHSLSPHIHNTAFQAQGVNAVYVATPVRPAEIEAAVAGLRALQFLGANVTTPHKEAVQAGLDTLTERAAAVGAVNTIVRTEASGGTVRLRGDNTDVAGFLAPLARRADDALQGAPMLVFGAGGAARAVVYGLLTRYRPERLTVVARRPEQAESLAASFAEHDARDALRVSTFDGAALAVRTSRLVVNATPLGMAPDRRGQTPWPSATDFGPEHVVYDLVYTPEATRLLQEADAQGATSIGGLDMLVEQAAAAYQQWTGRAMPREAVYEALRDRS